MEEPIAKLVQDQAMIEHLISELDNAARAGATRGQVIDHLDGIGAITESHVKDEEARAGRRPQPARSQCR